MKTVLCLLLASSIAFADPPDTDSPILAPDIPGVSVRLRPGEQAPFDGRLISLDESLRRGRALVDCRAELEAGKESAWVSKPVLISLIVGALALGAAVGAGATYVVVRR